MILIIDNYDSFTYNIYQYMSELGADLMVARNDKINIKDVEELNPAGIIISPGPRTPKETGISTSVILTFGPHIPTLGICLGHQCIGFAYGASIGQASEIMHGKTSMIFHDNKGVLSNLPVPFEAIRYHSLCIAEDTLPDCLEITARTSNGIIMGIRHKEYPIEGVQFHPESIMTNVGKDLLSNFLEMTLS